MVIDVHVHPIFYDLIYTGEEEQKFRRDAFGVWKQSPMDFDEIFAEMEYGNVERAVLLPLDLTSAAGGWVVSNDQVAAIVRAHPERFIGFAGVDPLRPDAPEVLDRAFGELGLSGLKLNPSRQRFMPDDPRLEPVYRECVEYDQPILFHAGMSWEPNAPARFRPPLLVEEVFIRHPELRCGLAHFGWPWVRETVMLLIKYPNVFADTSVLYLDSPEESIRRLFTGDMGRLWVERAFPRQVMFGSNGPRFRAFKLLRALEALKLEPETRENLYRNNALRFLNGGD